MNGNWVRDQFPGNRIPANRFDPVGVKIANLYPEPNTTTAGSVPWQNNFFLHDNVTWYDFHNFADAPRSQLQRQGTHIRRATCGTTRFSIQNTNGIPGIRRGPARRHQDQ